MLSTLTINHYKNLATLNAFTYFDNYIPKQHKPRPDLLKGGGRDICSLGLKLYPSQGEGVSACMFFEFRFSVLGPFSLEIGMVTFFPSSGE